MEIKYAVDQIDEDIVVLEDIESGQLQYISRASLDFQVNEKDIVIYDENGFRKDEKEKEKRLEIIKAKFDRVRRNKKNRINFDFFC